jgi:ubiquinone biosynthesis protein UbiJ
MQAPLSQQLMFAQALSAVIETLINQALVYNMHGTRALIALEEKTLTVKLSELGFPLNFSVNAEKIHLTTGLVQGDCTLTTSIKTLIELKNQQQLAELIKQDKLDIDGDIKIAQRFATIAESLDIDWRSELAKRIGDIPTYKIGQLGKSLAKKFHFTSQQIQADATEWLVYEKNIIITSGELSNFTQHVAQVTEQVSEISQRIESLITQRNNKANRE